MTKREELREKVDSMSGIHDISDCNLFYIHSPMGCEHTVCPHRVCTCDGNKKVDELMQLFDTYHTSELKRIGEETFVNEWVDVHSASHVCRYPDGLIRVNAGGWQQCLYAEKHKQRLAHITGEEK